MREATTNDTKLYPIVAFVYVPAFVSNVNVMFCVTAPAVSYEYIILAPPREPRSDEQIKTHHYYGRLLFDYLVHRWCT